MQRAESSAGASTWRQAFFTRVLEPETSTHPESATAVHRAGASLLDQSELHGGSVAKGQYTQVPGDGGEHSPPECSRQRRAHASSPQPPCISWSRCKLAQSSAALRRLHRKGQHLQVPCSISRSSMPALSQRAEAHAGAWIWRRQARLSTQVLEPETSTHLASVTTLHIVEQVQACSISRSFMAAPSQRANTCRCLGMAASTLTTLHPSARCRDEHAPCVRHRCA